MLLSRGAFWNGKNHEQCHSAIDVPISNRSLILLYFYFHNLHKNSILKYINVLMLLSFESSYAILKRSRHDGAEDRHRASGSA